MTQAAAVGTRERILAAAATVLSQKGYAAARLSDISELADLRTPAVYYYFDSREHLINEVMTVGQRSVIDFVTQALANLPANATPVERLDRAVQAHLEIELQLSDFATAVTRNIGQLPNALQQSFKAEGHLYFDVWDGLLRDLAAAGLLVPDLNLRVARMLVLGALNWTAEWWNAKRGSLETVVAMAQSFVREGLSPA